MESRFAGLFAILQLAGYHTGNLEVLELRQTQLKPDYIAVRQNVIVHLWYQNMKKLKGLRRMDFILSYHGK